MNRKCGQIESNKHIDRLADRLADGLVESQKQFIKLIEANPSISKREMAEKIGINSTAIDKNLKTIKSKNIIYIIGNDKTGHWRIIK